MAHEEIIIKVTVRPGMSMWDAIKMRIAGKGSEVFWDALAKKISVENEAPPRPDNIVLDKEQAKEFWQNAQKHKTPNAEVRGCATAEQQNGDKQNG